ncbi:MAG: glycosyltransferase [Thermoplasmata archaeon]|nr:glycosyltransferase [Thermoplasmata archaeon]
MSQQLKKISVILNVLNEERNISDLMDSIVTQEQPLEVIVIDAGSCDRTVAYVKEYAEKYDFIRLFHHPGTRGESTNFGLQQVTGDIICFIGGDCIANPFWLQEMRRSLETADIVAGKTINIGYHAFEDLGRVELFRKGFDISYPSHDIGFKRKVIEDVKGFDPWFITAEDIDLNLRAVDLGNSIAYNDRMIIYHRTRGTFFGFVKQAFWNGYGRKQLTLKHGRLWKSYDPRRMFDTPLTFWALVRLAAAFLGYGYAKLLERYPSN